MTPRALGFAGTAKHNLTLEELTAAVDAGLYPIVFVNLDPVSGKDAASVVCVRIGTNSALLKARIALTLDKLSCYF